MTSAASAARQRMIERNKAPPIVRQDEDDSTNKDVVVTSKTSHEAKQRMLARIAGRTYSAPGPNTSNAVFREDSADKLAWYWLHLQSEGYSASKIGEMLRCQE